jgi:hypothetical protein
MNNKYPNTERKRTTSRISYSCQFIIASDAAIGKTELPVAVTSSEVVEGADTEDEREDQKPPAVASAVSANVFDDDDEIAAVDTAASRRRKTRSMPLPADDEDDNCNDYRDQRSLATRRVSLLVLIVPIRKILRMAKTGQAFSHCNV